MTREKFSNQTSNNASTLSTILRNTVLLLLVTSGSAYADINFNGLTRFIFKSEQKQQSITIENTGQQDVLIQLTLEPPNASPTGYSLPMTLSTPLLKVPANDRKTFSVLYQGTGLPLDRETFFLLNVLEIPASAKPANTLQVALRHRLKLFFRPQLPLKIEESVEKLSWTQKAHAAQPVKTRNDSPYFLTITNIQLFDSSGHTCGSTLGHLMIAPRSEEEIKSTDCMHPIAKIKYTFINDDGLGLDFTRSIPTTHR